MISLFSPDHGRQKIERRDTKIRPAENVSRTRKEERPRSAGGTGWALRVPRRRGDRSRRFLHDVRARLDLLFTRRSALVGALQQPGRGKCRRTELHRTRGSRSRGLRLLLLRRRRLSRARGAGLVGGADPHRRPPLPRPEHRILRVVGRLGGLHRRIPTLVFPRLAGAPESPEECRRLHRLRLGAKGGGATARLGRIRHRCLPDLHHLADRHHGHPSLPVFAPAARWPEGSRELAARARPGDREHPSALVPSPGSRAGFELPLPHPH